MNIRNLLLTLGFLTASIGIAQGPLYDRVIVNVPYAMNVNGTVLQPGDYEIRQHESTAGGSRIVHFFTDQGMKLETTAMAIPTVDNRTPTETKLILEHIGPDYYLNKIWVQGKDYGYEFPLPDNIKNRENERNAPTTVVARYQGPTETVAQSQTTTTTTERTETAQTTPPPAPAREEPAPAPAPAPVEQAQAQPAPAPAPEAAAPAPTPAPAAEPTRMAADRTMPSTAGNWLNLLLGGGLLTSSGLALRRFRA